MSGKKTKTYQSPALALANAWRKLDARARSYGTLCKRRRDEINNPPSDELIDTVGQGVQEAAIEFAAAVDRCNRGQS